MVFVYFVIKQYIQYATTAMSVMIVAFVMMCKSFFMICGMTVIKKGGL